VENAFRLWKSASNLWKMALCRQTGLERRAFASQRYVFPPWLKILNRRKSSFRKYIGDKCRDTNPKDDLRHFNFPVTCHWSLVTALIILSLDEQFTGNRDIQFMYEKNYQAQYENNDGETEQQTAVIVDDDAEFG